MDSLFPIRSSGKWGYINRNGEMVVEPRFDKAEEFSGGMGQVWLGSQGGYVDGAGRLIIDPRFASTLRFEEGRALVFDGQDHLVIDAQGETVTKLDVRPLREYHAGLCVVQTRIRPTRYGYINHNGETVIEPRFMPAGDFPDDGIGLAVGGFENQWCYFNHTGEIVIRTKLFDQAEAFQGGLLRLKESGWWGYRNSKGEWAIEPKYDAAEPFEFGRAHVQIDGRAIVIDAQGQPAPERDYKQLAAYSEGLALVEMRGSFAYIDEQGNRAFRIPSFEKAGSFSCGRALVKMDGQFGYIDTKGQFAIPCAYSSACDFRGGLAWVMFETGETAYLDAQGSVIWRSAAPPKIALQPLRFNVPKPEPEPELDPTLPADGLWPARVLGRWGFVNARGKLAIEPQFRFAGPFVDGVARVNVGSGVSEDEEPAGGLWGFIDRDGRFAMAPHLAWAGDFQEGFAAAQRDGKSLFVSRDGYSLRHGEFDEVSGFSEGLAVAGKDGKLGYIDPSFQWVIPPAFDRAWGFCDGLAAVKVGKKCRFIDRDGRTVLSAPEGTTELGEFGDGLAPFRLGGLELRADGMYHPRPGGPAWGYLDRIGRWLIPPRFRIAAPFHEGRARVFIGGLYGYIDQSGTTVIPLRYQRAGHFRNGLAGVLLNGNYALIRPDGSCFWSE